MNITLNEVEIRALRQALDAYLPELNYELARVKLERDRHELVVLADALARLRDRLANATGLPHAVEPHVE